MRDSLEGGGAVAGGRSRSDGHGGKREDEVRGVCGAGDFMAVDAVAECLEHEAEELVWWNSDEGTAGRKRTDLHLWLANAGYLALAAETDSFHLCFRHVHEA